MKPLLVSVLATKIPDTFLSGLTALGELPILSDPAPNVIALGNPVLLGHAIEDDGK